MIGAGVFGCVTAIELAQCGHDVELFDRRGDIMAGASGMHQGRLHEGYHYPRAEEMRLLPHSRAFARRFPETLQERGYFRQHYAVADRDSLTSPDDFVASMRRRGLYFTLTHDGYELTRAETVALTVRVNEQLVSLPKLRNSLVSRMIASGVAFHRNLAVAADELPHDVVVRATGGEDSSRELRFEVCETVVADLEDERWRDAGVVVMDGPFGSIDPIPERNVHMLYGVCETVHHWNVGTRAEVPEHLRDFVRLTTPTRTRHTRFGAIVDMLSEYVNLRMRPRYVSSRFAVRATLPDVDKTDERPTLVERVNERVIEIVPGKMTTAPWAAARVAALLENPEVR